MTVVSDIEDIVGAGGDDGGLGRRHTSTHVRIGTKLARKKPIRGKKVPTDVGAGGEGSCGCESDSACCGAMGAPAPASCSDAAEDSEAARAAMGGVPGTASVWVKTFGCSHNQSDSEVSAQAKPC